MLVTFPSAPLCGTSDPGTPVIVGLHFLGGSAIAWHPVIRLLEGRFRWVLVDLPGFGLAAGRGGYSVAEMADTVVRIIAECAPRRWVLAGHSMGAKVALAVARRAEDGDPALAGLEGLILLAGSPPSPEPMTQEKRSAMLGWFAGDAAASQIEAKGYIAGNVGVALPSTLEELAVADVLRTERAAWTAWLTSGSREDWSDQVGVLRTPALIVAGEKDDALGPKAQAALMAPHFKQASLRTLPGTGHLLPLEQPDLLAALFTSFVGQAARTEPGIGSAYLALIGSDRVSARTRSVLLRRAEPVEDSAAMLSVEEWRTLRAVVDRVVPQDGDAPIDIPARMVASVKEGRGDGWRFADLPPDTVALAAGLRTLAAVATREDGSAFGQLGAERQDALLRRIASGAWPALPDTAGAALSPAQMGRWFEDMRSAATQAYVAHPATQARLGYSGIANRGEGAGPQGFIRVGIAEREPWEPVAAAKAMR